MSVFQSPSTPINRGEGLGVVGRSRTDGTGVLDVVDHHGVVACSRYGDVVAIVTTGAPFGFADTIGHVGIFPLNLVGIGGVDVVREHLKLGGRVEVVGVGDGTLAGLLVVVETIDGEHRHVTHAHPRKGVAPRGIAKGATHNVGQFDGGIAQLNIIRYNVELEDIGNGGRAGCSCSVQSAHGGHDTHINGRRGRHVVGVPLVELHQGFGHGDGIDGGTTFVVSLFELDVVGDGGTGLVGLCLGKTSFEFAVLRHLHHIKAAAVHRERCALVGELGL